MRGVRVLIEPGGSGPDPQFGNRQVLSRRGVSDASERRGEGRRRGGAE